MTAGAFLYSPVVLAQQVTIWTDDGSWASPSNWSAGVPTADDEVRINGNVSVAQGEAAANANSYVAYGEGSSGSVTVSGPNSTWSSGLEALVGRDGVGSLTITDGGRVAHQYGTAGYAFGSTGTVRVSGAGSEWINTKDGYVGFRGEGFLFVSAGGRAAASSGHVGHDAGASGIAVVDGPQSEWNNSLATYIGTSGTGVLTISGGGKVTDPLGYIGYQSGSSGTVNVTGSGSVWQNTNSAYIGHSGAGILTITDGGSVASFTGYVGYQSGSSGTVTVNGSGSAWKNTSSAYIGHSGTGILTITGGASVTGYNGTVGHQHGSSGTVTVSGSGSTWGTAQSVVLGNGGVGTLNIGSAQEQAASQAGQVTASSIVLGQSSTGSGTLVFNHTDQAYDFVAPLSSGLGSATIKQLAGTTRLSGDSSDFLGATQVSGGALHVNGKLGGAVSVTGGSLGGTGALLGNINIASGGTLAPGNSIGTLTVNGAAGFASGSTLAVEVDGTKNADRLNVGGTVQIDNGARMTVKVGAGTYGPQTSHTVLTAAGGITGMFDVSSDLYFFTPTLQQLGSDLVLTLDRKGSVISLARNGNQLAAARAIEKLGDNSPVLDAFMPLDEAGARQLLTSAAGEIHASGQTVIEQTFSRFTGAMSRHRRTPPGVVEINGPLGYVASGPQTQASQATAAMAASVAQNPPPPSLWIAPVAGMGQINDDGINGGLNWITGGITLGVDQTIALAQGDASVGLALGYLRSQADAVASSIDTSAGQIGVYGNLDMGPLSISGTLAYGLGYSDSRRTISGGGTNLIASSSAFTHTLGGSVELAYAVRLTEAMTISPLFRLDASVSQRGASVETGAGAFNLAVDESVWGQIDPSLGFEFKQEFATDFGLVTASGGAAWRHSLVDAPSQTLRFAGTDASFTLNGRDQARDSLSVDLGIALSTAKDLRLFADYAGRVSVAGHDHGVRVGLGGHL